MSKMSDLDIRIRNGDYVKDERSFVKNLSRILPPCRTCDCLYFEENGLPVCRPTPGSPVLHPRDKAINDNRCDMFRTKGRDRLIAEKLAGFNDKEDISAR